jgi:DNA-binding NtrC family response regulator
MVTDDGSRNGVFVNGEKVTRAELADGDLIEIGHCFFRFRAALPTPRATGEDVVISGTKKGLATLVPSIEGEHEELARIARANVPVVLLGESGAGKEVVARALHELSGRTGAFVPINCGAIPRGLVESQLFGHKKGSFSGATRDEPGFFRAADGGTIFLDELGDLPTDAQTTLLRVLEDRAVVPVGSTKGIAVDVRVIAATHRALQKNVSEGTFRHDLFARLSGFVHALAPLRDRREDLGIMVNVLLAELAPEGGISFGVDAALRLLRHPFPLNVRELRQCLASSLALAEGGVLQTVHLPGAIAASVAEGDDLEGRLVELLAEHRGNVAAVARAMGKAPVQINRWMKRFRIDVNSFRDR